jgi:hypothetical protein
MTAIITQEHRTRMQEAKRLSFNISQLIQDARLDLDKAQEAAIARRLESMPETCRRTYLRAMGGRSLAAAVKAFCLECVGWDRQEVARCTALACPLYPYRPFGRERRRAGRQPA